MAAQRFLGTEAGTLGHLRQWHAGGFQQILGDRNALAREPFNGCKAGRILELALQGARAHGGACSHAGHSMALLRMGAYPVHQCCQPPFLVVRHGARQVLGLAALAVRRHHQALSQQVAHMGAVVAPHQVQQHVQARRKIIGSKLAAYPAGTLFVVYCAGPHCNGAARAAIRLATLGRPVKIMAGGITGWLDEGFALSEPAQEVRAHLG